MKKAFPFFIVALLLIVLLIYYRSAHVEKIVPPNLSAHTEQISFFHYFTGSLSGGIDDMVTAINDTSPERGVVTNGLDHEAFKTMIIASLDRQNPPELFSYWAGERVHQLALKDQLLPIDDLWKEQNLSAAFPPAIVESAVTYQGHKYLIPITQHIVVFFYNKKTFDDLQLSPPESWKEFLHICDKLQESGQIPLSLGAKERWPAQFWFDYLLLRTAGPQYRQELMQGNKSYTDDEVKKTYKIWAELLHQDYFNPNANQLDWAQATDLVRQRKAGMTLMGTWATQLFEAVPFKLRPGEDYDFFTFPIIDENIPYTSLGPVDGVVISQQSENHAFAKEVLTYFASQDAQQLMSAGSGSLSPSSAVPDRFYPPFKLRLKKEIERSKHWAFNYDLATWADIADRGMDSFNELIEFPDHYEKILHDLQNEVEDILLQKEQSSETEPTTSSKT